MIARSSGRLKGMGFAISGMVIPIVAMPVMMGIALPALFKVRMISLRMVCGSNMSYLGKAILQYADENNEYPTPSQWCDLLQKSEPNYSPRLFRCKGDSVGPSSYAMNLNVAEFGADAPPNMVLLFESKPGWNQYGGPELLNLENHQGEGCNILFCDGHAKFVLNEDTDELQWTAGP